MLSKPRPNCVSITGFWPSGSGTREFWVEKDLIQFYYKQGWMNKFKALYSVKEIAESPSVIFQGLRRDGQDEALCYAGLASIFRRWSRIATTSRNDVCGLYPW